MAPGTEISLQFHNRHVVEMQEGIYAGWGHVNSDPMSLHLFGHPKSRPTKPSPSQPWSGTKDVSKQFCHAFTYRKCPSPCKSGRIHKCCKCNSLEHGAGTCSKAD